MRKLLTICAVLLIAIGSVIVADIGFENNRVTGNPQHWRFNLSDPSTLQGIDGEWCIVKATDAALTVTQVEVSLHEAANELTFDLMYADAFIGQATPVVINDLDTTSGVRDDSSITSGSVAAGKAVYISFDGAPHADITQAHVTVTYDYD